jgi:hypothetical protein
VEPDEKRKISFENFEHVPVSGCLFDSLVPLVASISVDGLLIVYYFIVAPQRVIVEASVSTPPGKTRKKLSRACARVTPITVE